MRPNSGWIKHRHFDGHDELAHRTCAPARRSRRVPVHRTLPIHVLAIPVCYMGFACAGTRAQRAELNDSWCALPLTSATLRRAPPFQTNPHGSSIANGPPATGVQGYGARGAHWTAQRLMGQTHIWMWTPSASLCSCSPPATMEHKDIRYPCLLARNASLTLRSAPNLPKVGLDVHRREM